MNPKRAFALLVLAATGLGSLAAMAAPVYLRVNQVGYDPADPKIALALSNAGLSGQTFKVQAASSGAAAFSAQVGKDRGRYGNFAHLYELDFSALKKQGSYRIRLGGVVSPAFALKDDPYRNVIPVTLRFFRVQRCGDTHPSLHGACHLKDGKAQDGPAAGSLLDVSGGWHDAGDYLKFLITTGLTTVVMLAAYQDNPGAFEDADRDAVPDVLDEARIGLDWIYKLWDPKNKTLYYQVGDASDHERWRMPEEDANLPPRPVWACGPGKGANVAGKAAAALALASAIWKKPGSGFSDPALASKYLAAAKAIYAFGKSRPGAQSSTSGFYEESSWRDDMALAAAELFRATGTKAYLNEARVYGRAARNAYGFSYADIHALAQFEIGRLDPRYRAEAAAFLADDLETYQRWADRKPFRAAVEQFWWGSATEMTGAALTALWYQELTGKGTYRRLAVDQRDFLLGVNPWGVCFVNSIGSQWPRTPHHQVADLTGSQLAGFWDEGPINKADWDDLGITLQGSDKYAAFQSNDALFHDDVEDYGTNEPTLDAAAHGLALAARLRSSQTTRR